MTVHSTMPALPTMRRRYCRDMGDEYREALQFMENINLVLLSIEAPGADTSSGEKLQGLEQSFLESRRTVCADAADAVFSRAVLPNSIAPTHIAPCEIRSLVSDTPNFLEAIPPLLEKLRVWQMLPRVKALQEHPRPHINRKELEAKWTPNNLPASFFPQLFTGVAPKEMVKVPKLVRTILGNASLFGALKEEHSEKIITKWRDLVSKKNRGKLGREEFCRLWVESGLVYTERDGNAESCTAYGNLLQHPDPQNYEAAIDAQTQSLTQRRSLEADYASTLSMVSALQTEGLDKIQSLLHTLDTEDDWLQEQSTALTQQETTARSALEQQASIHSKFLARQQLRVVRERRPSPPLINQRPSSALARRSEFGGGGGNGMRVSQGEVLRAKTPTPPRTVRVVEGEGEEVSVKQRPHTAFGMR